MDRARFLAACESAANNAHEKNGIGTLSEKSIHSVLKKYYEPDEINTEVKIGRFYADISGENGIIEIQTQKLFKLQKKLDIFLDYCPVTVVHPVISEKTIVWLDKSGKPVKSRKSPVKGSVYDALYELYGIKYTLDNPNMTVIIPVIKARDYRCLKQGSSTRKKPRYQKGDKIPTDIEEELILSCADDYRVFLPEGITENFCSDDLSKAAGISLSCAQVCLNILSYLKLVERIGKKENYILYRIIK